MFLDRRGGRRRAKPVEAGLELRLDLALQALQRPVAAADYLRGDGRQRHDRPELRAAALELEPGDVVLDAVVVRRERRGPHELDGPVRRDERPAGERGAGTEDQHEGGGAREEERASAHGDPFLPAPRPSGQDDVTVMLPCIPYR